MAKRKTTTRKTAAPKPAAPTARKKKTRKATKKKVKAATQRTRTQSESLAALAVSWDAAKNKVSRAQLKDLEPGMYLDLPFADYCHIDAVSNSRMNLATRSMAHYRYRTESEETKSLALGSFIHDSHLEPELLQTHYFVIPEEEIIADMTMAGEHMDSKGKPYKSIKATANYKRRVAQHVELNAGKTPVPLDWWNNTQGLLRRLAAHPSSALLRKGHSEVTMVWIDPKTGLRCKGRIDYLSDYIEDTYKNNPDESPILVDLKTTQDALNWTLDKWGYHRQAAFYVRGFKTLNPKYEMKHVPFYFIVGETSEPWGVRSAPQDTNSFFLANAEIDNILSRIKQCTEAKSWPGYDSPPSWGVARYYKSFLEDNKGDFYNAHEDI